MGRKLALIDDETGEVLEVIATAEDMVRRNVHKAVMNHIHNTLDTLQGDKLEQWVREAVTQSVSNTRVQSAIDTYVRLLLEESYTKSQLRTGAMEIIAKRLEVSVKH